MDVLTARDGLPATPYFEFVGAISCVIAWRQYPRIACNLVQRLLILGTETEVSLEEVEESIGLRIPVFSEALGQNS